MPPSLEHTLEGTCLRLPSSAVGPTSLKFACFRVCVPAAHVPRREGFLWLGAACCASGSACRSQQWGAGTAGVPRPQLLAHLSAASCQPIRGSPWCFSGLRVLCTRGLQKNHSVAQWSSKESWGALDTTRVWVSDANDAAGRRGSHIGGRQHTHGVVKKHAWCVATGRGGFRSGNGKSRHNRSVASTEGARTHTRGLEGHCQRGACIEHAGRDVLHLGETRSAEGRKRGKRKGGRDLHDVQSRSRRGCGRCEGWGAAV